MKTEHRHELETNDLAKRMAVGIEAVKPYSTLILASLGLLVGMYIATSYWSSQRAQEEREFWESYQPAFFESGTSPNSEAVYQVAADEKFSVNGQEWAYLTWADRRLAVASSSYLYDRDTALEGVGEVFGIYEQLSTSASSNDIRNRSKLGLARCLEMQNKLDEAADAYASVRGVFQPVAQERLQALESKERRQAIEWLATAKLPSSMTSGDVGSAMQPGVRPGFAADIPETDPAPEDTVTTGSIEELLGRIEGGDEGEEGDEKDRYEENAGEDSGSETSETDETESATPDEQPDSEETSEAESQEEAEPAAATVEQ